MSRIFTHWKCSKCGAEFQRYVSFGHPLDDFVYKWKCSECEHVNELLVEAMPMFCGEYLKARSNLPDIWNDILQHLNKE